MPSSVASRRSSLRSSSSRSRKPAPSSLKLDSFIDMLAFATARKEVQDHIIDKHRLPSSSGSSRSRRSGTSAKTKSSGSSSSSSSSSSRRRRSSRTASRERSPRSEWSRRHRDSCHEEKRQSQLDPQYLLSTAGTPVSEDDGSLYMDSCYAQYPCGGGGGGEDYVSEEEQRSELHPPGEYPPNAPATPTPTRGSARPETDKPPRQRLSPIKTSMSATATASPSGSTLTTPTASRPLPETDMSDEWPLSSHDEGSATPTQNSRCFLSSDLGYDVKTPRHSSTRASMPAKAPIKRKPIPQHRSLPSKSRSIKRLPSSGVTSTKSPSISPPLLTPRVISDSNNLTPNTPAQQLTSPREPSQPTWASRTSLPPNISHPAPTSVSFAPFNIPPPPQESPSSLPEQEQTPKTPTADRPPEPKPNIKRASSTEILMSRMRLKARITGRAVLEKCRPKSLTDNLFHNRGESQAHEAAAPEKKWSRSSISYDPAHDPLYAHIRRQKGQHFPGEMLIEPASSDPRRVTVYSVEESRRISPQEAARATKEQHEHWTSVSNQPDDDGYEEEDQLQLQRMERPGVYKGSRNVSVITEWPGAVGTRGKARTLGICESEEDDGIDKRTVVPDDSLTTVEERKAFRRRWDLV